jgi:hypothetical protein
MTPAISPRLLHEIETSARVTEMPVRVVATISTTDGRFITGGTLDITAAAAGWRGRMRHMDRAGTVATMYFGGGVRDVVVRLEDGRQGIARIAGTSFIAASQRICDLIADEPLVQQSRAQASL